MKLSPEKNIQKKSSSFFIINSKINAEQKNISFTTTSANINVKDISGEIPKKIETLLDFIKQKKKFNLDNIFDVNGAKDFLSSKEKAMIEIKLDDEIMHKKKKKNSTVITKKSSAIELKNEGDIKSKNSINKKAATIISKEDKNNKNNFKKENRKKYTDSKYKNKENNNNNQGSKIDNDNNNILIIDELNQHSKESNFFYKFIIDNANDSEDEFQKKLEKILTNVENKRRKNKNERKTVKDKKSVVDENNNEIFRSNSVKNLKKRGNIFIYSEKTKNLMENEDIDISSIGDDAQNIHKISSMKNNVKIDKNNIFFGEKEKKFIEDDKKDSLVSFLNELK